MKYYWIGFLMSSLLFVSCIKDEPKLCLKFRYIAH